MASESPVKVAVLDTGFYFDEELAPWFVLREGCSERVVRCVLGADVADLDDDPFVERKEHGYRMLRTLISTVETIDPDASVRIMPVRIESPRQQDGLAVLAEGLGFARAQGAQVVSISYGGSYATQEVSQLLQDMHEEGIVVVAASGNDPQSYGLFPARYRSVIGVGARTRDGWLYAAKHGTDVVVPADLIDGTVGSSAATAVVSGYMALLSSDRRTAEGLGVHLVGNVLQPWIRGASHPIPPVVPIPPILSVPSSVEEQPREIPVLVPLLKQRLFPRLEDALEDAKSRGLLPLPPLK